MVDIVLFTTPFDASKTETFQIEPGTTIARFLFASELDKRMQREPIVVRVNGDEITSAQYDYVLDEFDIVTLHVLPQDGGASLIAYLVVALAVSYYVNSKLDGLGDDTAIDASPTYNINARGNSARLGSPKPVFYGRVRTYPDLGAIPYTEYDANGDQILYQLFEVRQGQCNISVSDMRFEDTPLTSFEGYETEVIAPGSRSTIFPGLVVVSTELEANEIGPTPNDFGDYKDMHHGVDSPPDAAYYACDIGQEITRVSMDVVADGGIYRVNPEGKLRYRQVNFRFEARRVDNANVPIGGWFTLSNEALASAPDNYRAAIRRTFTYAVTKGRYEIRTVRTTTKSDNSNVNDVLKWVGLRGFVAEDLPVTDTTRIALKIRASEQLGRRGAAKFNVISEGKIPTWHPSTGWGAAVVTANPAWVFADILHNNIYGAGRGDAFIDLPGLYALATQLDAAEIEFHGGFDTATTVWDALTKVAAVAQAKPVDRAGVYYMVRDVQASAPAYMFSHANIVKDSFRLDYSGVLEETADAYRLLFLDKDQDYRETDLICALPGSPQEKIKDVKVFGAVDKNQVFNWGMYLAAADFYRRRRVEFQTGIEGYLPFYYDTVSVSHYLIGREGQDQVSGDVIAFDGVNRLTLSENVDHLTTPYIVLRNLDGSPTEPYLISVISSNVVQIAEAFDASGLVFDAGFERPHFMCGEGEHFFARVKIDSIKPAGKSLYTIAGFIDAPEVYGAAVGLPTPPVTDLPLVISIAPVIKNFTATLSGTVDTPIVILRWDADNADYFIVQMSYNAGVSWATIAPRLLENTLNHDALIGDIKYRVCGMNVMQGQYQTVDINTGSTAYVAPAGVTGLALVGAFVGQSVSVQWNSTELNHKIAFYDGATEKFVDYVSDINQYTLHASTLKESGLGRSFIVKVWSISPEGKLSAASVDLAVSNPAPAALTGISVVPSQVSIEISWNQNSDADLAGYVAYMSATSGFTPALSNRVYKGLSNKVTITSLAGVKLNAGQTYYVRVAAYDIYGEEVLNYSSELSATILSFASGIGAGEITATMIANGALDMTKFASGIRPPRVVTSLPSIDGVTYKNQDTVLLTTDGKLYRVVSGSWSKETDGADLKANSILAGSISAGAVGATQIAANAVTTEKILIGSVGAALNSDPACIDSSAWAGGLTFTTVSDGVTGNNVIRGTGQLTENKHIPVDQTKVYRVRFWVRRNLAANGTIYGGLVLLDSAGANIGSPMGTYWYVAAVNNNPGTAWTQYSGFIGPGTANPWPGNVKTMLPLLLMNYGGSVGYYEIQDFRIEEVLPSTLIQDGAVITGKLAANAVTADKVNTNSLTSDTGFINNLFANTFTARKVTATEIDSRNLTIRDGSGNIIFSAGVPLDAAYAANNIRNSAISLNSNGTINGAGGGAVTIGGLGYTGALNATKNTVTRSSTEPVSSTVGDIWIDTSGIFEVVKTREALGWIIAASFGAILGNNVAGQITAGNASTLIANAAIGTAQIGNLNASVITAGTITTDKIQVGAVTAQSHFSSSSSSTVGATSTKAIELALGSFTSTGVASNIQCSSVMELGSDFSSLTGLNSATAFFTADVYLKVDGVNKVVNSISGSVIRAGSTYYAHVPFSFIHREVFSAGSHSVSVRFEAVFLTAAGAGQNQSSMTECTLKSNCLVQENKV